ncbi:hypothetical protein [Desertivibrio insolitus]|nr:hypothetical protein [Herbiconiux sp. SYSU D00978]
MEEQLDLASCSTCHKPLEVTGDEEYPYYWCVTCKVPNLAI